MQSLGRSLSRSLWSSVTKKVCVNSLSQPIWKWPTNSANCRTAAPSVQCNFPAIQIPRRFYSTKEPPKDQSPLSNGQEAVDSGAEKQDPSIPPSLDQDTPHQTESPRNPSPSKVQLLVEQVQARILAAPQTLNELTGYAPIEQIKNENANLELALQTSQENRRKAQKAYKISNTKRGNTQREVNALLARKETWSPQDLEHFTQLYRADHVLEGEVADAQVALTEAEAEEESLSQRYIAGIMKRYHEEQIWSDGIRKLSSWATWALMGMNFLLFVVAGPWQRSRMAKAVAAEEEKRFLEKERVMYEEVIGGLREVKQVLEKNGELQGSQKQDEQSTTIPDEAPVAIEMLAPEAIPSSWQEFLKNPAQWKIKATDLVSERRIELKMKEASMLALQGVAAGATVVGTLFWVLRRT